MSDDFTIHVVVEGDYEVDEALLRAASEEALKAAGMDSPVALAVTITSNERIRELNRQFADKDEATDVLSFGQEDSPYAVEPGEPPYYGDVIIAYPFAEQQAGQGGHPVIAELQLLAVHGTLHLLGYDHDTPDRQAEMWALQSLAMDMVRTTRI